MTTRRTWAGTFRGKRFHSKCFVCCVCAEPLSGGGELFVEIDGLPACRRHVAADEKPTNVRLEQLCARCSVPVEGNGQQAGSKLFHADCFKCDGCSVSLVGSGFIAEADDHFCQPCWHKRYVLVQIWL